MGASAIMIIGSLAKGSKEGLGLGLLLLAVLIVIYTNGREDI
jgi:hypothetical protein